MRTFEAKDPNALKDYLFNWSRWLGEDEISTYDIVVPAELSLEDDSLSDDKKSVLIWLSGGQENKTYEVTCSIVTVAGRVDERSARFPVNNV